jgi:hypothetical protein
MPSFCDGLRLAVGLCWVLAVLLKSEGESARYLCGRIELKGSLDWHAVFIHLYGSKTLITKFILLWLLSMQLGQSARFLRKRYLLLEIRRMRVGTGQSSPG